LYRKELTAEEKAEREGKRDAELAQWGMTRADVAADIDAELGDEDVNVFPECWPAVLVFAALRTQWRMGFASATGLDYAAIPVVMDFYGVEAGARRQMFDDIRVMEVAALETIRGDE
jgi:hypothetical protein